MGLFKSSSDHQHRSQASVGSAVSSCPSSSSSASAPARDRTPAARSPAPKFVNSLVTWEKQNEQQQPPPLQPKSGERAKYAHAGTDWEARNARQNEQADSKEPPKKPSWTKRLFKGPGLGVYGS